MNVRTAYEELLAVFAVAAMFTALGYVTLTGEGLGHYLGSPAEASGYPGVRVISENISTFRDEGLQQDAGVHVIHRGLRDWSSRADEQQLTEFHGDVRRFPL